ncbi:cytidine deaminase [Formosa algae]|uniref:Cytidine deaminase n=1 Tax=Formosa algae TaxID=225843 RepID=A0A9X0YLX4_9FLAO|nr:cytidine deaminase [Formosa algae]MBP1839361.1 cytidine deaminase [Formosa algae]MDQ0334665.1 cytidine deaminase [Formosa algae]OEI81303.1 cytidine deaminase [Formosa algae]PNW27759.1 cytidine deaminase [Formosa algae]
MKTIKIETEFEVYDDLNDVPKNVSELMEYAVKARLRAYAPYSKFLVGAAILLDNGEIVTGNNQENACYPSGLCAERTAIYYAGSKYPEAKIVLMALIAGSTKHKTTTPVPPCGACRQAISEYEVKQDMPIDIYFMGETGEVIRSKSLSNLLPFVFEKAII